MALYAGHLLAPAEGFGQGVLFLPILGIFFVFNSNLCNFVEKKEKIKKTTTQKNITLTKIPRKNNKKKHTNITK